MIGTAMLRFTFPEPKSWSLEPKKLRKKGIRRKLLSCTCAFVLFNPGLKWHADDEKQACISSVPHLALPSTSIRETALRMARRQESLYQRPWVCVYFPSILNAEITPL